MRMKAQRCNMLGLNFLARRQVVQPKEEYYAVMIQLNYDSEFADKSHAFFSSLYFELTVNFGFNFVDRVFYRVDTKESIASLLTAAIKVIMMQQRLTRAEVNKLIKHALIIPLKQFDEVKGEICGII